MLKNLTKFVEYRNDQQFALNLLKVLAMLLVTISHYGIIIGSKDRQNMMNSNLMIFMINSLYAVDLFFLVSGIMLGQKIAQNSIPFTKVKEGGYIILDRILRVYPVYWLVLSIYAGLPFFIQNVGYEQNCQDILFDMIFLIQNITNKFGCFEWSWYIAVEIQILILLILVFVLAATIVGWFKKQTLSDEFYQKLFKWVIFILLFISIMANVHTCISENYKISFYSMTNKQFYYNFYQKPLYKMPSYLIGILYGLEKHTKFYLPLGNFKIKNMLFKKTFSFLCFYFSLYFWIQIKENQEIIPDMVQNFHQAFSRVFLCIAVIYSGVLDLTTSSFFLNYLFQIMSKLLYSIYLTHYFIIQIFVNHNLSDSGLVVNFITCFSIIVVISSILYYYFEKQLSEKIIAKLRKKLLRIHQSNAALNR